MDKNFVRMRSNLSNNLKSMQLGSSSNRDINFRSMSKLSQQLDNRSKSVMPQLKGKTSHIYLNIKAHKSLQESDGNIIRQIRQQLQNPTTSAQGDASLNNYIQWKIFDETKQLLKDQYHDNQLYYIIVPEKHLSWAQTFAKEQRAISENKKRIHVLGMLRQKQYQDKMKTLSKKRADKILKYLHYYSMQNAYLSKEVYQLISDHIQMKIKHEDNHVKSWALSNKYAEKKVKRRTVHIYFSNVDKSILQHLYTKYNSKSHSSWLQLHPYSSFYDIVKSIKQRQALNYKEANKASQITQQLTSRLLSSKSQLQLTSVRSFAMLQSNQLMAASIQSVSKLSKDDVNVIISRKDFEQRDKLVAFVKAQKLKNWQLVQIDTSSPQFYSKMSQIFQIGKTLQHQYQHQRQQKLIQSKTLFIICSTTDQNTRDLFYRQDNVFHNMELLLYSDLVEFSILLREGVQSKDNYTVVILPSDSNMESDYQKEIREFMRQYKNRGEVVDNFTFFSSGNGVPNSIMSGVFQRGSSIVSSRFINSNDEGWLEWIMSERDRFFHPFKGLKGVNVYLLVKHTKQHLIQGLREHISQNQRLHIGTYIDKQYLKKQLQNIQIKDSAIVITDDHCLRQAQQVLMKFNQAFIINVTERKNVKQEVKVFAWGNKEKLFELIKTIPEVDHKLESEIYVGNLQKISLTRPNRLLPRKIPFLPGDTIALRLPADLTCSQSRKMQIRLKRYFNQDIKIIYYKQPSDIRMRNKTIEPLTFVILCVKELQYMKVIAKKEIEEKRQEFILFCEKPNQYRRLIEKPQYERFCVVSNSWEDIENYIIGVYQLYVKKEVREQIYEDQLIHVLVDSLSCEIQKLIQSYVDRTQLKSANNTRFHLKSDLQNVILMYPPNHKFYYLIQENNHQKDNITKRKITEQANTKCKSIEPKINLQFILVNSRKNIITNTNATLKIKCIHPDEKATADWIASIKVRKVQYLNSRPYVLIDKTSMDWYYFLDKYSLLTYSFRFLFNNTLDEMRKTIEKIRIKQPAQEIWIVAKSIQMTKQYKNLSDKVQSGRNISIIFHGQQEKVHQQNKIIFSHPDRLQIQKFILNPFRRSLYEYFPSVIANPKVILATVNSSYKQFKTIPLNQGQISNWKRILNVQMRYFSNVVELIKIAQENPNFTVYAVLDAISEQENYIKLERSQNIKRLILKMSPNYNPRKLMNNFRVSNKVVYEAAYPAELNEALRYLRYNIRNPPRTIQKKYPKELTQVYMLNSIQIPGISFLNYIQKKNDSIVKIRTFQPQEIQDVLDRASQYEYNIIFIGDDKTVSAVNERNTRTNTMFKCINVKVTHSYRSESGIQVQMQTSQIDEVKMYLYNLPQKRYERIRGYKGKFQVYYDILNQNKLYLQVIQHAKKAALINSCIQLHAYQNPRKLKSQVNERVFVILQAQDEARYDNSLSTNKHVQFLIVNQDQNRNFSSSDNNFFVSKNNREYQYFFNNLLENNQSKRMDDLIKFSKSILDNNPPTLNNIPLTMISPPTKAFGSQRLQTVKSCKVDSETKTILPVSSFHPSSTATIKILYYQLDHWDIFEKYSDYQKIQFKTYLQLYELITIKYGIEDYTHWIIKDSTTKQLTQLLPKVYMQDKSNMRDFKNDYIEIAHKHNGDNGTKSKSKMHEFTNFNQCFYNGHKHLESMLQQQPYPSVVLINGSSNKMLEVKNKYNLKHKFLTYSNQPVEFFHIHQPINIEPYNYIYSSPKQTTQNQSPPSIDSKNSSTQIYKKSLSPKSSKKLYQYASYILQIEEDNINETSQYSFQQNQEQNDSDSLPSHISMKSIKHQNSTHSLDKQYLTKEDQVKKLNVHTNIRHKSQQFKDEQLEKIKQLLDDNQIVLLIEYSRKDQVRHIIEKYNILVQHFTNAINLQNAIKDRKDSATIAVISTKIVDKAILLKEKYKSVMFILLNDTQQEGILQTYKPYISRQVKQVSDLQKIIRQLIKENQRIKNNETSLHHTSQFQTAPPTTSLLNHSNNQKLFNAISNHHSKRAFLFYKEPKNNHVKLNLFNHIGNFLSFVPYQNIQALKIILDKYNSYISIVIANGEDIPQIEDFISKKKENVFVIRLNALKNCKEIPNVQLLFSTCNKNDLEDYLFKEFMKIGNVNININVSSKSNERIPQRLKSPHAKINETKKYTRKYQPNSFGTTPRLAGDLVPGESMKETYAHKLIKSQSRSKLVRDNNVKANSKNVYFQS